MGLEQTSAPRGAKLHSSASTGLEPQGSPGYGSLSFILNRARSALGIASLARTSWSSTFRLAQEANVLGEQVSRIRLTSHKKNATEARNNNRVGSVEE